MKYNIGDRVFANDVEIRGNLTIVGATTGLALDGYALDSALDSNWAELNSQTQALRDACDGYGAPDTTTIDAHWTELNSQTQSLRDVLDDSDGYVLCDGSRPLTGLLKFEGTTADYPALKAVGNGLHARLASDDGYCFVSVGNLEINGQAWSTIPAVLTPTGTTQNIDWSLGAYQILDLESASGNVTLTFSDEKAGASYVLEIRQDSSVALTVTFPDNVWWADGISPVISIGANAVDVCTFVFNGANFFGSCGKNYS